ncbi:MAG: acetyl-CoA C-acyltransferase, partial [Gammaproteobacteria bacterium]|nr:acetyl-CoA C-acyltransferase [Gammaproteobacteria bacterium]
SAYMSMGETAENLARQYQIPRSEQEQFALTSQQRATGAQAAGKLADEITEVAGVGSDGCIRSETTLAALAHLQPAFHDHGSVTAGTASPL